MIKHFCVRANINHRRAGNVQTSNPALSIFLTVIFFAGASTIVQAGRPLTVDDAGTDDAKAGHVEIWLDRQGNTDVWNFAPTYAPATGLEISIPYAQQRSKINGSTEITKQIGVSLKWVPFQHEYGWSAGASATILRNSPLDGAFGKVTVLNSIFTYGFTDESAMHLNVGSQKNGSAKANTTWGIAYERSIGGFNAHIETFGAAESKPTTQIGLRYVITRSVQIDGTIGRATVGCERGGNVVKNIGSIGLKFDF